MQYHQLKGVEEENCEEENLEVEDEQEEMEVDQFFQFHKNRLLEVEVISKEKTYMDVEKEQEMDHIHAAPPFPTDQSQPPTQTHYERDRTVCKTIERS